ncbi:substrate-binding periplasmic protein [Roseateles koreensis]|uniref:Transporter substrate-binding domain-containing protein n=1 Tax=Roseateles koreensis TaxID=2987526 RepID=A0ABT5KPR9_9BURK|nr:transporter substrate-binding domain-containing protein [Roseateles koreensis]MDC8784903.1 transporter substrate-binding domain-containing protein [Roseateles koreensis]
MNRRNLLTAGLMAGLTGGMAIAPPAWPQSAEADIIVMLEDLHPYSYRDTQGAPAGYAVEIAHEMLRRAGLNGRFEITSWSRVLAKGRTVPGVLIPAIVRLPEREKEFYWVGTAARRQAMLYRRRNRADISVSSMQDIHRYRTAVVIGDASEHEMLALGLTAERHLDRSADYGIALRRFFSDRADLLVISKSLAPTVLKQYGYNIADLEPVLKLRESASSVALSLGTEAATRNKLQQAFDAMHRDGALAELAARYPAITLD